MLKQSILVSFAGIVSCSLGTYDPVAHYIREEEFNILYGVKYSGFWKVLPAEHIELEVVDSLNDVALEIMAKLPSPPTPLIDATRAQLLAQEMAKVLPSPALEVSGPAPHTRVARDAEADALTRGDSDRPHVGVEGEEVVVKTNTDLLNARRSYGRRGYDSHEEERYNRGRRGGRGRRDVSSGEGLGFIKKISLVVEEVLDVIDWAIDTFRGSGRGGRDSYDDGLYDRDYHHDIPHGSDVEDTITPEDAPEAHSSPASAIQKQKFEDLERKAEELEALVEQADTEKETLTEKLAHLIAQLRFLQRMKESSKPKVKSTEINI